MVAALNQLLSKRYQRHHPENNLIYRTVQTYLKGSWVTGLKNTKRVLYNLPQMLKSTRNGHTIYFVEGEKCAEALINLGFCAVTVAGGVNGWAKNAKAFIPYFKDTNTVIIPDNDEPGKSLGKRVYSDIVKIAKSVRYLELPNLSDKEDVVDWIIQGGTSEKLQLLVEELPEVDANFAEDELAEKALDNEPIILNENLVSIISSCYCKKVKNSAVSLTNFIINPLYKIQASDQDSSIIKAELITKDGGKTIRHMSTAAFDNVDLFRQTLNDTKFRYTGRIEELQHIKTLVDENIKEIRKGVTFEGLHKLEDKWYVVSGDKTIDEALTPSVHG